MNDGDTDLNNKIINGKSGEMTASRNSFHSVANEIISDQNQKIREGRLPTQNQISKRRTVLGQKPEYTAEKPLSKRNSIDADLLKIQKEKNDFIQNDINNNNNMNRTSSVNNNNNETKNNFQFKQDVLTKQAIEEIKDNIEMFKMDINRYVNELKEEQEKIELGDVKE